MSKPVIKVHHYGGEPPKVEVPEGLDVEIEFIDDETDELLFMTHNGVKIYRTYWGSGGDTSEEWFAFECGLDAKDDYADQVFDNREFSSPPEQFQEKYEKLFPGDRIKQRLAYSLDIGELDPENFQEK